MSGSSSKPTEELMADSGLECLTPARSESQPDRHWDDLPLDDVTQADHSDRPLIRAEGELVDALRGHHDLCRLERVVRVDRDRVGGHPLPSARLARVPADSERHSAV